LRFKTASAACARQANAGFAARARQAVRLLFGPSTGSFSHASYLRPAGAVALLLVGFFAARITAPRAVQAPSEPIATRIRYIQPDSSGRMRIVVDETRQKVLTGGLDDERVLRTLLTAARDPEDPGLRGESIELLKARAASREVRGTLVFALRHDPNAGVRLRALEALRAYSTEPESRRALVDVLLADDNPGVRTQAVDLLTQQKDISVVPAFQRSLEREDNSYVRLRLQTALREMNASMETF
jgi:HEAT repeat protein